MKNKDDLKVKINSLKEQLIEAMEELTTLEANEKVDVEKIKNNYVGKFVVFQELSEFESTYYVGEIKDITFFKTPSIYEVYIKTHAEMINAYGRKTIIAYKEDKEETAYVLVCLNELKIIKPEEVQKTIESWISI
jgi:hypothetical protein